MSICATCSSCGAKLQAREKYAGKQVKCPKCGEPLAIPTQPKPEEPQEQEDEYGMAEAPSGLHPPREDATPAQSSEAVCPECGNVRAENAVLCVHCGLDFRTGKKLTTELESAATANDASWEDRPRPGSDRMRGAAQRQRDHGGRGQGLWSGVDRRGADGNGVGRHEGREADQGGGRQDHRAGRDDVRGLRNAGERGQHGPGGLRAAAVEHTR